ncbi:hypothetical protein BJ912DRAFT_623206 [Pholiota molesta]|nr:hypothetical protein BJ912DRAFT_623206 [Pholiota molesta]
MAPPKSTFDDLAYLESLQSTTSPLIPTASSPKSNAKLAQQARPSSSTSSNDTRNASKPSTGVYDEQNFDLFSTLFSPSTPRASPDMISGPLRAEETKSKPPPPHLHHRSASISSQSSDFGAFVSVSTFDDPLTAQLRDFDDMLQEPTPTRANGTSNTTVGSNSSGGTGLDARGRGRSASRNSSSSSHSASRSLHTNTERPPNSNPTLNFFDQFAQEAKQRSG